MAGANLLAICPKPSDLGSLSPEDLGGLIVEVVPSLSHDGMFTIDSLLGPLYPQTGDGYPSGTKRDIARLLAEGLNWLVSQGIVILAPEQIGTWYCLTRRGRELRTRADVQTFRKGRILPDDLIVGVFRQKVVPLFRRGDYDVAVFQAFKEVEVAVRLFANAADNEVGVSLMRKAFNPENGPLADMEAVYSEREALMHLLSGAIGHAKNPTSHRHVKIDAAEAASLIIFANYLYGLVAKRVF